MHISTVLVFWSLISLVRNSVVLAVFLLFSVSCFFTVHEHFHESLYLQTKALMNNNQTHNQFQTQEKLNHHKNWFDDIFYEVHKAFLHHILKFSQSHYLFSYLPFLSPRLAVRSAYYNFIIQRKHQVLRCCRSRQQRHIQPNKHNQ